MVSTGGFDGVASGLVGEGAPLITGTVVSPSPARYATRYSPAFAGDVCVTSVPSLCCAISVPSGDAASPGVAADNWIDCGVVSAPPADTITWYCCAGNNSNGICASICPGLT